MPKIYKNITNLANIAPIGGQYPVEMTEQGDGLARSFETSKLTNVLPSSRPGIPTLPLTDATTLYVQERDAINVEDDDTKPYEQMIMHKARPFCWCPATMFIPVMGASYNDLKVSNDEYDGQYLNEPLGNYLGVTLKSKGSTTLASLVQAVENMNVKVQNAFNRPLPFNTLTREERYAALANYHADVFQLMLMIDTISGMLSWVYHASDSMAISTKGIESLYSPTLFANIQTAYNAIKQFPILDTVGASMIQRYSKIYAATEKAYYPGSYHMFNVVVPAANTSGSVGSGANTITFNESTNLASVLELPEGKMTTKAIHDLVANGGLEEALAVFADVSNAITNTYSKVIQFCIQATAKGIYSFKALDEFLDFNDEGICIYAIEKNYQINNLVKNLPITLKGEESDGNNVEFVLTQLGFNSGNDNKQTIGPNYKRYVNPYTLSDDIYTTYELLSSGVWDISLPSSYGAVDAVTGLQVYVQNRESLINAASTKVTVFYSTQGTVTFPLLSTDAVNIVNATSDSFAVELNEVDRNDIVKMSKVIARTQEIIDQFDLLYYVVPLSSVAGKTDRDILLTDMEEDAYFLELSESALETPNADVYSSAVNLVTWLDGANKSKTKFFDHAKKDSAKESGGDK